MHGATISLCNPLKMLAEGFYCETETGHRIKKGLHIWITLILTLPPPGYSQKQTIEMVEVVGVAYSDAGWQ